MPDFTRRVALPGEPERVITVRPYGDVWFFRCDGPECSEWFHYAGCRHAIAVGQQLLDAGYAAPQSNWAKTFVIAKQVRRAVSA